MPVIPAEAKYFPQIFADDYAPARLNRSGGDARRCANEVAVSDEAICAIWVYLIGVHLREMTDRK
jgi:hypothetical protein